MRKLVTLRTISELRSIPDAEAIETAVVDGWEVIVKRGAHVTGETIVFLEVDSWVPTSLAPFLANPSSPKFFNGVEGTRLRTIRLRKQLSQGLILPLEHVMSYAQRLILPNHLEDESIDLAEALGVQKWEPPVNAQLAGTCKGSFPSFIPKTGEERVQNLPRVLQDYAGESFEVTTKLDGSSCTMYFLNKGSKFLYEGEETRFGVCSKNLELKETPGNAFWDMARKLDIEEKLRRLQCSVALQGELVGPSIQNNYESVKQNSYFVYKVFNIDTRTFLPPDNRRLLCNAIEVPTVPVLETDLVISEKFTSIKDILKYADGPGMNPGVKREGAVFKHNSSSFSFKAISNSYLLREK